VEGRPGRESKDRDMGQGKKWEIIIVQKTFNTAQSTWNQLHKSCNIKCCHYLLCYQLKPTFFQWLKSFQLKTSTESARNRWWSRTVIKKKKTMMDRDGAVPLTKMVCLHSPIWPEWSK
jgi:hypothetical protein